MEARGWRHRASSWIVLSAAAMLAAGCGAGQEQSTSEAEESVAPAGPTTQACSPIDDLLVASLFDRWNASLATGDVDKVVANYAPEGVLQSTSSATMLTTPEQIRDYYARFLQFEPSAKVDERVIYLGCNMAVDTGNFTLTLADGSTIPARYSFTYAYQDALWRIVSEHSSLQPPVR